MSLRKDLEMILPCINCGVNADPADGFGSCTCGNADRIENIINLIESVVDEIIGEAEQYESHQIDWSIEHRNQLRKEQRDIKSKLIGEDK